MNHRIKSFALIAGFACTAAFGHVQKPISFAQASNEVRVCEALCKLTQDQQNRALAATLEKEKIDEAVRLQFNSQKAAALMLLNTYRKNQCGHTDPFFTKESEQLSTYDGTDSPNKTIHGRFTNWLRDAKARKDAAIAAHGPYFFECWR